MDEKVKRYYRLKLKQKEIERELSQLRDDILAHVGEQGAREAEIGGYRVKLVRQERKEFDEGKLFEAFPDPQLWRMMSRPDPAKIAGLVKLNVIPEARLEGAFTVKAVTLLQVEKK